MSARFMQVRAQLCVAVGAGMRIRSLSGKRNISESAQRRKSPHRGRHFVVQRTRHRSDLATNRGASSVLWPIRADGG
jgi:hypothetical protein